MRHRLTASHWLARPFALLAPALLLPLLALAAEPPQPTPEAIALDAAIQGLKDDTLELNVELQRLERHQ